jgi:hypothetical protein
MMMPPGFWASILRRSGEKEKNTGSNTPNRLAICNPPVSAYITTLYAEKSKNSEKYSADFKPKGKMTIPIAGNALFDKGFRRVDLAQ